MTLMVSLDGEDSFMPSARDKRWDAVFDAILKGKKIKLFIGFQLVPKDRTWLQRLVFRDDLSEAKKKRIRSALDIKPFHVRDGLLTKEQMDSMEIKD